MSRLGAQASLVGRDDLGQVAIVGSAIPRVQRQFLEEGPVLDQRHGDFGEHLVDAEPALRLGRALLDRQRVRLELQALVAVLDADHDADPVIGPGRFHAVFAQIGADIAADHGFLVDTPGRGRRIDIVERGIRNAVEAEDVERNALRVAAVDHRSTGGHAVHIDHLDAAIGTGRVDVVLIGFVVEHGGGQDVRIVADAVGNLAPDAAGEAVIGVAQIVTTRPGVPRDRAIADIELLRRAGAIG